jgi:hypothetical protein
MSRSAPVLDEYEKHENIHLIDIAAEASLDASFFFAMMRAGLFLREGHNWAEQQLFSVFVLLWHDMTFTWHVH